MNRTAAVAAALVGLAAGWSVSTVGAVAPPLADDYGVGLALVGVFTTALFLTHALAQIPSGRAIDRFGTHRVALAGALLMVAGNALAIVEPDPALAIVGRAVAGVGSGAGVLAGAEYARVVLGGALAQGIFGGMTMGGAGLALAVVPLSYEVLSWRAPFVTMGAVAAAAAVAFLVTVPGPTVRGEPAPLRELLADPRLRRLAVVQTASLGLTAILANWLVTLLLRAGGFPLTTAGAMSALTLGGGIVGRPLGGLLLRRHPGHERAILAASVVGGALGTALLVAAKPLPLVVVASAIVGVSAGLSFAAVFGGAARARPDAPGAAVGLVNVVSNLSVVVGTPLLGLAFSLPGDGRIGFAAVAALWALALFALPPRQALGPPPRSGMRHASP